MTGQQRFERMVGSIEGAILQSKREEWRSYIQEGSIQKYQILPGDLPDLLIPHAPVMCAWGEMAPSGNCSLAFSDIGTVSYARDRRWETSFRGGAVPDVNLYLYVRSPIGRFVAESWVRKQGFFDVSLLSLETPEFIRQILSLTERCQETGAPLTEVNRKYNGP